MGKDAFATLLLDEVGDAAQHPLAAASRKRLTGTISDIDHSDLNKLNLDALINVMDIGRSGGHDALIESALSKDALLSGERVSFKNNFLPTDIDDRLRAALLIIQKYPENISEMLLQLWSIFNMMQTYIAEHAITSQSPRLTPYDKEVFTILDIITNIARYAHARMISGTHQTFGPYLFSGSETDLRSFLSDPQMLFEVYTHKNDIEDDMIQDFIRAIKKNKHSKIVLGHQFPQKTPFLEALLEILRHS